MIKASSIQLLRIPFSVFLSPLYFFALSQVPVIHPGRAVLVFIILHFLIYPASNGYNSYMDQDSGPIGGIEKPPPASRQLYYLTIGLDLAAIAAGFFIHPLFPVFLLFYIGASKAYSYRKIRLKKYPVVGYLTVILFQGALTFALVYHGCSLDLSYRVPWQGMLICALLIGGFYPLTQVYQHQQDRADGVETISYKLGYNGTFVFCAIIYALAWVCMAQYFLSKGEAGKLLMVSALLVPVIIFFVKWFGEVRKDTGAASFNNAMRMNWLAAICTNIAFIVLLIWNVVE